MYVNMYHVTFSSHARHVLPTTAFRMWSSARTIAEGDLVIAWLTRDSLLPVTVTPGLEFNCRFGAYRHSDLLGVPYGSKIASRNGRGFVHILRPTPELWTMALNHRTQILYLADISFITARIGLRPGMHVLEAGTGSGSFTHSVARTVGSTGRVYTFEFHQTRATKAREEFQQHGISDYVILEHRNVCKDGFGLYDTVDAIFLDLPMPWDAVPYAKQAARKDRIVHICCFSPCIEQVQRTVSSLNEHGFTDITMYETLLRPYEVSRSPSPLSVQSIRKKLQVAEQTKEERRLHQIAISKAAKRQIQNDLIEPPEKSQTSFSETAPNPIGTISNALKRKHDSPELHANNNDCVIGDEARKSIKLTKLEEKEEEKVFIRMEDNGHEETALADKKNSPVLPGIAGATLEANGSRSGQKQPNKEDTLNSTTELILTQSIKEVRGHTSYLTFACLLPSILPDSDVSSGAVTSPSQILSVTSDPRP